MIGKAFGKSGKGKVNGTVEKAKGPADRARATAAGDREIDLGPLENYIGFHLRLAQNASFKAFKRHTGESDLKPGWFAILSLIGGNPGITPVALSRASGRDKSTITPILRDLMRVHLIAREPVAGDRRSYALSLTPTGREKLANLSKHAASHDAELDAIVGERKGELLALLRRIATEID
jgi:DNA-binding MarR family transcriptional regulator